MNFTLNAEDINSLIHQYFIERGLHHSAFLLSKESKNINTHLPPNSLITYLEKSLAFEELQTHIKANTQSCLNEFKLNHTHNCAFPPVLLPSVDLVPEILMTSRLSGHTNLVTSLSTCKGLIISCSKDGTIRQWRPKQHPPFYECNSILPHIQIDKRLSPVVSVDINQFGSMVSLSQDGISRIWSAEGQLSNTIQSTQPIISSEWDNSGHLILTNTSNSIDLWDKEGLLQESFSDLSVYDITRVISRSPSEFTVQTSTAVYIWRTNEQPIRIFQERPIRVEWSLSKTFLAIQDDVGVVIYQDDYENWWLNRDNRVFEFLNRGNCLAAGSLFGDVFMWDLERRNIYMRISVNVGKIEKIVIRKDDEFVLVKGEKEAQVSCLSDLGVIKRINLPDGSQDLTWIEEGNRIALAYKDQIAVYNLKMT